MIWQFKECKSCNKSGECLWKEIDVGEERKTSQKDVEKRILYSMFLVDLDMDWVVNMMDSTSRARFIALILYIV